MLIQIVLYEIMEAPQINDRFMQRISITIQLSFARIILCKTHALVTEGQKHVPCQSME